MSLKDFTDAMEKVHTTKPVKPKLYARSALEEHVFKEMFPGIEVVRMEYYDEFERAEFTGTLRPIARSDVDASELRNFGNIDEMHLINKKGE